MGLLIVYYVFSFWAGWKWPTQFGTVAHLELVLIALGSLVVAMIFYLCLIITEDQLRRLEGRDA